MFGMQILFFAIFAINTKIFFRELEFLADEELHEEVEHVAVETRIH